MTVMEWIKANAKDGANLAEVEEMLDRSKLPETKEQAWDFIQKNQVFRSALDAEVSRATAAHDVKFMENKFPDILKAEREKLLKELNPQETPEKKEIREIREELAAAKREKEENARKDILRKKAAEIGFDPLRAEKYSVFGDNAEAQLLEDHQYMTGFVKTELEKETKKRFGNTTPAGGGNPNQKKMPVEAFNALSPKDRAAFMAAGGGLEEGV